MGVVTAPGTGASHSSIRSTGSTDLAEMLISLSVTRRPGRFTLCAIPAPVPLASGVEAVIAEDEAVTVVATVEAAAANGWPYTFEAAWLTLDVHSALDAVGLTAAVSRVLTDVGVACNVIAGFYHDHILVPVDRVEEALTALAGLRS